MPALVNIKVGSLRGTNGDEATMSWPLSAKNLRKVDLISLTPLMKGPIAKPSGIGRKTGLRPANAFRQGSRAVQKQCRPIRGLQSSLENLWRRPPLHLEGLALKTWLGLVFRLSIKLYSRLSRRERSAT